MLHIIRLEASWCPDCIIMKNRWEEIEKDLNITTEVVDIDEEEEKAEEILTKYKEEIEPLPVIIVLKDEEKIITLRGEQDKRILKDMLNSLDA